jgi:hypothetical protein
MKNFGVFIGSGGATNYAWNGVLMSAGDFNDKLQETLAQNGELRKALELADSRHTETCIGINKHPYPDIENCKCWQKIKYDALQGKTEKRNAATKCFWCGETIQGESYKDKFGRMACMSHRELIEAMTRGNA